MTARVSIEAGIAPPWWRWLGSHDRPVPFEHYGASADFKTRYKEFGITADAGSGSSPRVAGGRARRVRPQHRVERGSVGARRHRQSQSLNPNPSTPILESPSLIHP